MQHIIEQSFLNIEGLGSRISKGEYDLVNSDGAVIIPHLWENLVEPDMLVTLQIWSLPSPQKRSALSATQFPALLSSPERLHPPAVQSFRPPPPTIVRLTAPRPRPPPPPPPSRSPRIQLVSSTQQMRSTSHNSDRRAKNQNSSRKSVKWSLFWPLSPAKTKSTKSKPPPLPIFYNQYAPSYDCTCWECYYEQSCSEEQLPVTTSFQPQFKRAYPQQTSRTVEPKSTLRSATEWSESISKVEPIFELEGEQIYELE
jgi:Ubiquitin-like domain